MSSTAINTIPYNGGTISIMGADICSVSISATKTVVFYAQSNPNVIYAHVVNVTGLEGGTPTAVNGPQFAFGSTAARVRAYRMTATRLFVLMGSELRVIDIDANDNLILRNATNDVLNSTGLWVGAGTTSNVITFETPANMNQGTTFAAIRLTDDKILISARSAASYTHQFSVLTYDATLDTFTRVSNTAAMSSADNESFSDTYCEMRLAAIPGSANILAYMVTRRGYINSQLARSTSTQHVELASVIDTNGRFVRNFNLPSVSAYVQADPPVTALVPVSESVLLGVRDGKSLRVHTGSTAVSPTNTNVSKSGSFGTPVTFASNGEDAIVTHAEMINGDYFIMSMTPALAPTATGLNIGFESQTVRIVRYVDATFSEVVESSQDISANSLGVPLNPDGPKFQRVGEYTFFFPTKTSTQITDTRVSLRSIFGGNA